MECDICKQVAQKKELFTCDGCKKKVCKQCGKLTASEARCFELKERVMIFYCQDCREGNTITLLHAINKEKDSIIESKMEIIEMLKMNIEELKKKTEEKTTLTYSQVAAAKNESVLVVKPKDNKQRSALTRETVQEKINPYSLGTSVSRIKHISNGGVAICCNDTSVDKIRKEAVEKLGKEYEIATVEKKNPKLKIHFVNNKDVENEEEFKEKIIFHNQLDCTKEAFLFKVIHKINIKNNVRNCHVIVEVDPMTYKELYRNDYIQTGWKGCRYSDYINITQCYRCWKFGHIAKKCTSPNDKCSKCAGAHKYSECTSEELTCVNCKYAVEVLKVKNLALNHCAYDKNCEAYKRIFEKVKNKIEYPQIFKEK